MTGSHLYQNLTSDLCKYMSIVFQSLVWKKAIKVGNEYVDIKKFDSKKVL